jgi:hypothetical protein
MSLVVAQDVAHPGDGSRPHRLVNVSVRYSWWPVFRCPSVAGFGCPPRKEDFEYWLFEMDDALERFLQGIGEPVRSQLDFSPASLDALEAWVLERYANPDDL